MSKKIFLKKLRHDMHTDHFGNHSSDDSDSAVSKKQPKFDDVITLDSSSEDQADEYKSEPDFCISDSDSDQSLYKDYLTKDYITILDSSSDDSLPDITTSRLKSDVPTTSAEEIIFFNGDRRLPLYERRNKGIKTLDALNILKSVTEQTDRTRISTAIPHDINQNVCFLVDTEKIGHWKNILSDGMGSWVQTYTLTSSVATDRGILHYVDENANATGYRHQYRNKSAEDLHRIIIRLHINGEPVPYIYVQYYFDGKEHDVTLKPHGNAKRTDTPYKRTQYTTMEHLKTTQSKTQKPRQAFHDIIAARGGIDQITSSAEKPRNLQQIYNINRKKSSDPILEVLDLAKEDSSFIRDVELIPEFSVFLANDQQLEDVEKFCTKGGNFSVLAVDTTFNIGSFYLTMTTYRNLMMTNKKKGHEPVMIGPSILHQRRTFDSYFTLPSAMIKHKPSLQHIQAIGTDGDENLYSSMLSCFPFAEHLLCDIHMRDNVITKLAALGIKGIEAKPFIEDIFGSNHGTERVAGLVDSCEREEFTMKFRSLKEIWKKRHARGAEFSKYFVEHKAQLVINCMSASLRARCGMGFPPKPYTQNANESINSKVKKELGKDKLTEPDFIRKFEKIIKQQQDEVKFGILGQGEIELKPEYQHLQVQEDKFYRMTQDQKANVMKKYQTTPLICITDETPPEDTSQQAVKSSEHSKLSVDPENCHISTVPFFILKTMFRKAAELNSSGVDIVKPPGAATITDIEKWLVSSSQNVDQPHLVSVFPSGQVSCDKRCARWEAFKICSHTLAVAEKGKILERFLTWFNRKPRDPVYTRLANSNMPVGRGKKAQKATQVRKGAPNKPTTVQLQYVETHNVNVDPPKPAEGSYVLYLLHFCDKKVSVCYGCKGLLRPQGQKAVPANDLVVVSRTKRKFIKDGKEHIGQASNVYFHLKTSCIKQDNEFFVPSLIYIPETIRCHLTPLHQEILRASQLLV